MLQGIFPPIPTPFDERGQVDLGALRANLARWNETGLAGYVALGSNGEAPLLNADESVTVIQAVREATGRGAKPSELPNASEHDAHAGYDSRSQRRGARSHPEDREGAIVRGLSTALTLM